jgi:hypothetical protein
VKSRMEVYRSKAKEYAGLTVLTKLPRESRRYRKLAEMYWAVALGEEPENVQPLKMTAKTSPTCTDVLSRNGRFVLRRQARVRARREPPESVIANAGSVGRGRSPHRDILGGSPWLREIGQWLRAGYDGVDDPIPEHLAALLKELKGRRAAFR